MTLGTNSASRETSNSLRNAVRRIAEASWFTSFITLIIIANAITLGAATYDNLPPALHAAFALFDQFVIVVFVLEIMLKFFAYRWGFFRRGWNVFDLFIVGVVLVPGAAGFTVLRALRVLRVLRLISVVPMMRRIVEALFNAIPGMGAICAVLALMVYVGSVMATTLYGQTNPDLFGSLPVSALTLFQVITMDGWRGEILRPVMDAGHPYAWIFFLVFIVLASFAVLNLFMALIVEALNDDVEEALEEATDDLREGQVEAHAERAELVQLIGVMRSEIGELRSAVRDLRGDIARSQGQQ